MVTEIVTYAFLGDGYIIGVRKFIDRNWEIYFEEETKLSEEEFIDQVSEQLKLYIIGGCVFILALVICCFGFCI